MEGLGKGRLGVEGAGVAVGGGEELDAVADGGDASREGEFPDRDGMGGVDAALGDPGLDSGQGEGC